MPDFEPGVDFFERLAPDPPPLEGRTLQIGPFAVRMEDLPAEVVPPIEDRYLGFFHNGSPPSALRLSLRSAGVPYFLEHPADSQGNMRVRALFKEHRVFFYTWDCAGHFDPNGGTAGLALCRPGWSGLELPLENFFRLYWAWRAIDAGGFLIHAASIVRDGKTYVFFGHSGAGKSTVSELSKGVGFVLSDDITLITAEPGGFRAHSVPFRGRGRVRQVNERRDYPVAGLYHLNQGPQDVVKPLPKAIAVANVVSCLPFVTDRLLPRDPAETIRLVESALQTLPVFRLEFTRSPRFWDAVLTPRP